MTRASIPSLKDDGSTENCWVHDLAQSTNDDTFKTIFGQSRAEVGKCSDQQQKLKNDESTEERKSIGEPGYMQSLIEKANSGSSNYNEMPQYEHVVRLTGNGAIPTCSNHYGLTMSSQIPMEKNLGRLRPQLNPGESNESQHRINHRVGLIKERSRKAWDAIIGKRLNDKLSPFSPDTQDGAKDKEHVSAEDRLKRMISAGWGEDPMTFDDQIDDPSVTDFDKNYTHTELDSSGEPEIIEFNPDFHSYETEE